MKQKLKKRMAQILALSLVLAMTAVFVPQIAVPAYAEDDAPAVTVAAADVLSQNAGKNEAKTVWYAGTKWRVLSYDSSGNSKVAKNGAVTLFAADNFAADYLATGQQFNPYGKDDNDYAGSALKEAVDGWYTSNFGPKEKAPVIERTLEVGEYTESRPYSTGVSGTATSGYLWPLSTEEALEVDYYGKDELLKASDYWWLRSPGDSDNFTAIVYGDGNVIFYGFDVNNEYGVRPAFWLNLESVLFTSAAEGGKSSGAEGADALKAQSDQTNSGNEWKVTVTDSTHSGFAVSKVIPSENGASVTYTGAATGANEYISAIITDKPITDSSAIITYYGQIKNCTADTDASDTVTINTAGKLRENDHLYIFNEQCNGDKKTDYASELQEVTIPKLISYKVTFKVKNGAWNDGSTKDKIVTLSRYENEDLALKLNDSDIPAVGNKPNANYKAGSWDVTPSTGTAISRDTTYTYTYANKDPSPTSTTVSGTLMAKITAKGSKDLAISWNQITGAEGYDIFFVKCGKNNTCKLVKTIKGNKTLSWTKTGLKKKTAYKAIVKAYVMKDGRKSYVRTSPLVHAYTTGYTKNYTNPKSVTVKKSSVSLKAGKTYKIKASVKKLKKGKKLMPKSHAPKLRYLSSNTKIATVSSAGKITTKAKGSCKVYVYAVNGASKTVKVTVK